MIQVGDLLRIRPGEKVPVDGVITQGKGNVREAMGLAMGGAGVSVIVNALRLRRVQVD